MAKKQPLYRQMYIRYQYLTTCSPSPKRQPREMFSGSHHRQTLIVMVMSLRRLPQKGLAGALLQWSGRPRTQLPWLRHPFGAFKQLDFRPGPWNPPSKVLKPPTTFKPSGRSIHYKLRKQVSKTLINPNCLTGGVLLA